MSDDQIADTVAKPKRWYWDDEDQPRHRDCHGEVTFFETLQGEEAAICLKCSECGLNWELTYPQAHIDGGESSE